MSRSRSHAESSATEPTAAEHAPPKRISLAPPPMPTRALAPAQGTALTRHTSRALALDAADVMPCRVDAHTAARNFAETCAVIVAHRDELTRARVHFDWAAFDDTRDLGDALVLARAQPVARAPRTLAADLRLLTPWSSMLASDLRTLRIEGRITEAERKQVVGSQRGPVDRATSVLSMVKAYRDRAEHFVGYTAVTEAKLRAAETVANDLLPRFRQADTASDEAEAAHRDLRDRVWTLLVQQYETLARAAGALWGTRVKEHIPALGRPLLRSTRTAVTTPDAPSDDAPTK